MAQVLEHLPNEHETLNLNPSTVKKKKNKKTSNYFITV
jgi:hypothetical protein